MITSVACIIIGFIAFILYDYGAANNNRPAFSRYLFIPGVVLWVIAQIITSITVLNKYALSFPRVLYVVPFVIFVGFTVWSLFFAIPFDGVKLNSQPSVYKEGVYALCRHPGVLFLILAEGAYVNIIPCKETAVIAILLSVFDTLYIVFQDYYSFPKTLLGYKEYKTEAPFLIPTPKSVKNALKHTERRKTDK